MSSTAALTVAAVRSEGRDRHCADCGKLCHSVGQPTSCCECLSLGDRMNGWVGERGHALMPAGQGPAVPSLLLQVL